MILSVLLHCNTKTCFKVMDTEPSMRASDIAWFAIKSCEAMLTNLIVVDDKPFLSSFNSTFLHSSMVKTNFTFSYS